MDSKDAGKAQKCYLTYYLLSSREVFSSVTSTSFRLREKDWGFPAAALENLPINASWGKRNNVFLVL